MPETVHILASCRNLNLVDATLVVFKTIRVGFPNAEIIVWLNPMHMEAKLLTINAARSVGATVCDSGIYKPMRHDEWIEWIFGERIAPFWICDTDMAFFGQCEGWFAQNTLMAGRYIPAFRDPFSKTIHRDRLHTCLMWLNPEEIRSALQNWSRRFPESWMAPKVEFFRQTYWPTRNKETEFGDSCSGLWHTIGGTPFSVELNTCFEHLNCGTYSDLIGKSLGGESWMDGHRRFCSDPLSVRGIQLAQAEFYRKHAVVAHEADSKS